MNEPRYYLNTTYDADGNTQANVMECNDAFSPAIVKEVFPHEWRACKRIEQLKHEAIERGEEVIYNPRFCDRYYQPIERKQA